MGGVRNESLTSIAKNSRGEEQEGSDQSEDRAEAYANDAKRQREEPYQWRQDQHR